ncbi:MAG: hypothetical protein HQ508_00255 [Candidatus Marinimicrobia bacterium]|nr:hypothetical protein [Candidatus Neomarinimicrobiota bacterium]
MLKFRIIVLLIVSSLVSYGQVGTWENLPTLTEIRSLLPIDNQVIIASNGGLLSFDKSQKIFSYGISGHRTDNFDVNTVYIDSENILWIGSRSPGAIVEAMDLNTNTFLQVELVDIDEVTSFVQVGDSIYVTYQDGLEGGLMLYRKNQKSVEYLDLFNNFPNQSSLDLTDVGDVNFVNGKIIFRANNDILWVALDGSNLKDPTNWNVVSLPSGSGSITRLMPVGDKLLLSAGPTVYEYNFASFSSLISAESTILDMDNDAELSNKLLFSTSAGVFFHNLDTGSGYQLISKSGISSIKLFGEEVWTAGTIDFLSVFNNDNYESYSANRPKDHLFNRMLIDSNGDLMAGAQGGISIHSNLGWRTIRAGNYNSSFDANSYDWNQMIMDTLNFRGNVVVEDMIGDHHGNVYFALQGRGVLKLDTEQPGESIYYSATDGVLEPTFDSDTYVLPGQMAIDSKENIWLTTKFVREGGSGLTILGVDNQIYHINQYQAGLGSRTVKSIAIDKNDLIWIGSQVRTELQASGGINLIDFEGVMDEGMEAQISTLIGPPLASNEILQLEVDTHNTLWILTPAGVQSMVLPDTWLTSAELKNHANLHMTQKSDFYFYWQLTDYNVTGIEIDQRGNHWFLSSNAGVHVLQENGRWVNGGYGYNTGNSELLDNEIYSVAFDAESGQTYFSTPKGISILSTPFADPKEDYSSVHIYPQPFNPDVHDKVIIQGLMDNSSVKILTISGVLVKELTFLDNDVQGYEAQWDGRDGAGDVVGSGVYILYLFNEDGASASQKLAVLR